MNKKIVLILGILLTLTVSTLISFSIFRYGPGTPLIVVYLILFVPSAPGMSLSFYYYLNGSFRQEKPEVPLVSEEKIFADLNKDEPKPEAVPSEAPLEPQVIAPTRQIVPIDKPGEAIKAVMQHKVIEALHKCKVEVNINADMDLNGEFKDPKISVAFLTPNSQKPETAKPSESNKPSESDPNKLQKPRI